MNKGFTLAELLITVVILSVLTAVAIPNFTASINRANARQAIAHLRAIRSAEKMSAARNQGAYVYCTGRTAVLNAGCLLTNLGVEVATERYSFDVTGSGTTFLARTVSGGIPQDCTAATAICLSDTGVWSGGPVATSYTPDPATVTG